MAHINALSAVKFTSLSYSEAGAGQAWSRPTNATGWQALFESANGTLTAQSVSGGGTATPSTELVGSVREFPNLGTPANIVNVPVYGQSISSQVGGQADAPTLEFTVNYVPTQHARIETLRESSKEVAWRVRLTDAEDARIQFTESDTARQTIQDSDDLYDDFFFLGTVQSFEIIPSLDDSMTATFTVSINGDFEGPYSETPGAGGTYGLPA